MTGTFNLIRKRGVAADALQVANEVAALPGPIVREMAPLLAQAEREVANGLRSWLASAPGQGNRFSAYQMSRLLVQLRSGLDTIKRLEPALAASLGRGASRAGVLSAQHLTSIINRNSARFGTILDAPIRLDLARILATGQGFIPRFASSAARYSEGIRTEIRQQLAIGILRGESYQGLMQRLAGRANVASAAGVEPTPQNAAKGLLRPAGYQLERLVRTEMAHASDVQSLESFRQARAQIHDLRRKWCAVLDARTCARCAALEGELSDMNGDFAAGNPPAHCMCRCCAIPWRPSWGELDLAA